jgi:hypothetical protein
MLAIALLALLAAEDRPLEKASGVEVSYATGPALQSDILPVRKDGERPWAQLVEEALAAQKVLKLPVLLDPAEEERRWLAHCPTIRFLFGPGQVTVDFLIAGRCELVSELNRVLSSDADGNQVDILKYPKRDFVAAADRPLEKAAGVQVNWSLTRNARGLQDDILPIRQPWQRPWAELVKEALAAGKVQKLPVLLDPTMEDRRWLSNGPTIRFLWGPYNQPGFVTVDFRIDGHGELVSELNRALTPRGEVNRARYIDILKYPRRDLDLK